GLAFADHHLGGEIAKGAAGQHALRPVDDLPAELGLAPRIHVPASSTSQTRHSRASRPASSPQALSLRAGRGREAAPFGTSFDSFAGSCNRVPSPRRRGKGQGEGHLPYKPTMPIQNICRSPTSTSYLRRKSSVPSPAMWNKDRQAGTKRVAAPSL